MLQAFLGLGLAATVGCCLLLSSSQQRERERERERDRQQRQREQQWQRAREHQQHSYTQEESEDDDDYELIRAEQRRQFDRQQRRAAEERQRGQQAAERQQQQELWSQLAAEVDSYIRSRRKFDTAHPTQYLCQISSIEGGLQSRIAPRFTDWRQLIHAFVGTRFALSNDRQSVRVLHLTPFRGDSSHRVFGHFRCACGKRWKSAATWKDKWQQCQACETKVYPHEQHTLERRDAADAENEERRPHDMSRCQRCREKGSICMPRLYYAA